MRVVMPLFQFSYKGNEFKFSDNYSLEHFNLVKDIPQDSRAGLSELDLSYISQQNWALVATNANTYFKAELNLLLLVFRIYAKSDVFIKWRFCEENSNFSTCINDRFRNLVTVSTVNITEETLNRVKDGFLKIIEMYTISDRTKNALYFIWRGFCADKHMDAYILLVCAIESLFSGEIAAEVTKTVTKRIQYFLSGTKGFGGNQINKIYKIRSDMVHGRISHTDKENTEKRQENLNNLAKLEELVFACIERMLENKIYLKYRNIEEKENFFNNLLNEAKFHFGFLSFVKKWRWL